MREEVDKEKEEEDEYKDEDEEEEEGEKLHYAADRPGAFGVPRDRKHQDETGRTA